jgi:hypothetical protein
MKEGGKIILKWILKICMCMWSGFNWLRRVSNGSFCDHDNEHTILVLALKGGEFHVWLSNC